MVHGNTAEGGQDLTKRVTAAIDVLKSTVGDDWAMLTVCNKLGIQVDENEQDEAEVRKILCGAALDILTGERPV